MTCSCGSSYLFKLLPLICRLRKHWFSLCDCMRIFGMDNGTSWFYSEGSRGYGSGDHMLLHSTFRNRTCSFGQSRCASLFSNGHMLTPISWADWFQLFFNTMQIQYKFYNVKLSVVRCFWKPAAPAQPF